MACTFCRLSYLCVFSAMRETRTERGDPAVSRGCWPSAWEPDRHETGRGLPRGCGLLPGSSPNPGTGFSPTPYTAWAQPPVLSSFYFSSSLLAVKGRDHSSQQVGREGVLYHRQTDKWNKGISSRTGKVCLPGAWARKRARGF